MIKIESLKAGDVLYDVHSERAGNTTMRREGCWKCFVRAVDSNGKWVEISWNGNPARRFAAHSAAAAEYPARRARQRVGGRLQAWSQPLFNVLQNQSRETGLAGSAHHSLQEPA